MNATARCLSFLGATVLNILQCQGQPEESDPLRQRGYFLLEVCYNCDGFPDANRGLQRLAEPVKVEFTIEGEPGKDPEIVEVTFLRDQAIDWKTPLDRSVGKLEFDGNLGELLTMLSGLSHSSIGTSIASNSELARIHYAFKYDEAVSVRRVLMELCARKEVSLVAEVYKEASSESNDKYASNALVINARDYVNLRFLDGEGIGELKAALVNLEQGNPRPIDSPNHDSTIDQGVEAPGSTTVVNPIAIGSGIAILLLIAVIVWRLR